MGQKGGTRAAQPMARRHVARRVPTTQQPPAAVSMEKRVPIIGRQPCFLKKNEKGWQEINGKRQKVAQDPHGSSSSSKLQKHTEKNAAT
ncbi:hypothetical protein P8452_03393 [Trifolium repens]|nr:hypothetical protein P8452_03393 [Trifolium repens]